MFNCYKNGKYKCSFDDEYEAEDWCSFYSDEDPNSDYYYRKDVDDDDELDNNGLVQDAEGNYVYPEDIVYPEDF